MPRCDLCELRTPSPPVTEEGIDGEFCCRGCLAVSRSLCDVEAREFEPTNLGHVAGGVGAGNEADVAGGEDSDAPTDDSSGTPDPDRSDAEVAYLSVDGMHCATCETFLEMVATRTDAVQHASASYATGTMRVTYDTAALEADLATVVSVAGYTAHHRAEEPEVEDDALARFLLGGGMFGMMVMVWYVLFLYPTYFGYDSLIDLGGFEGLYLFGLLWLFTSFVLFYTGYPILRGAYVSLRAGQPNMDLLVAVAALGSYLYSTVAMGVGRTDLYFDVTVAIVLVVTAGNYYEGYVRQRATGLLSGLTEARVDEATLPDGSVVPVETLEAGDRVAVEPGDRVPVDGVVSGGTAAVDESLVTGESLPRTKRPDDPVRGGTVVTDAPLVVEVGADAESTLDRLVDLLWEIQSTRSGVQRFADRLATVFVPLVVALSVGAATTTVLLGGSVTAAVLIGLTVVIVSCPCALGLATPLAVATGTGAAARRNVVVASPAVFEVGADVDVVAFDKTGTLTAGQMTVRELEPIPIPEEAESTSVSEEAESTSVSGATPEVATPEAELLAAAAALERHAQHPAGDAIVEAATERGIGFRSIDGGVASEPDAPGTGSRSVGAVEIDGSVASVTDVEPFDRGVRGVVGDRAVLVGHPDCFDGWTGREAVAGRVADVRADGGLPVVAGWDGVVRGVFGVGDEPRAEFDEVLDALDDREVVVLTGDDEAAAERYRRDERVSEVFAGVPPEGKAEAVRRLRGRGQTAMVGDGSNDAPALAAADLGVSLGGTELATDAADVVVLGDDLRGVVEVFDVATRTRRRMRQNLGWAFVYNCVAIPLALTGLLNPLFAALAMAASSVLVVANSARSFRRDP